MSKMKKILAVLSHVTLCSGILLLSPKAIPAEGTALDHVTEVAIPGVTNVTVTDLGSNPGPVMVENLADDGAPLSGTPIVPGSTARHGPGLTVGPELEDEFIDVTVMQFVVIEYDLVHRGPSRATLFDFRSDAFSYANLVRENFGWLAIVFDTRLF